MGDGYGPLVIQKRATEETGRFEPDAREFLSDKIIAIPGKMTSAFLALQLFLGRDFKHIVVPFDQIFDAVSDGRAQAGPTFT